MQQQTQHSLSQLFESQIATLEQLLAKLQEEQSLLGQRDAEQISSINKEKDNIARLLEQQGQQFTQFLSQHDLSSNDDIDAYMTQVNLSNPWQRFLELLSECQKFNQTNAKIIDASMQLNDRILNVLLGNSTTGTYSADGQIKHSLSAEPLIKV